MPIRVYYEVLNQKGTPALYSDNYAQRPAAGFQGRIFNSPDTGQIFYDTGTTWTLLADAGVGSGSLASVCANGNTTATGISITAGGLSTNDFTNTGFAASVGYVWFAGTGGQMTGTQSFFWDNNNKWLGLGTNTPTAPFDIHTTGNIGMQINNTTTADSKIAFLNADVGKWRIGNLYSGGANLFHIYNNAGATLAMQINSSNAALFYGSLSANSFIQTNGGISLIHNAVPTSSGYTGIGGLTAGLSIALASGFNQTLTFPTGVAYTYTFPSATGTIALTSNLGGTTGYLPKYASGTSLGQSLFYDNGTAAYIGATSGGNALFNAIVTTGFAIDAAGYFMVRGDIGVGTPRQLNILCTGGNEVYFNTSGYGASYSTLMVFQTTNGASVNTNQLVLNQYGNVGIGTAGSSDAALSITGAIAANPANNGVLLGVQSGYAIIHLNGTSGTGGLLEFSTGGTDTLGRIEYNNTGNWMRFQTNGLERFRIRDDGNVGIGDSGNASVRLVVQGSTANSSANSISAYNSLSQSLFYVRNDGYINTGATNVSPYYNVTGSAANLVVDSAGGLSRSTSSLKYKIDVLDYDKGLDVIKQMRPVYYKGINNGNAQFSGFIAEEIHELGLTEFVQYADDGSPDALSYSNMTALLTKGIQQLDDRLTALENKLN